MKRRFFLPLALAAAIFSAQPVFAQDIPELFRQGNAAQDAGNFSEAEQIFRRAININPNDSAGYNNLGIALGAQGRLEEAITILRTAIQLDPNNSDAHYNLGLALRKQGNLTEAIASYRTAIRLNPNYANAYFNLGNILVSQGNLTEAIASYRNALRINPSFTDAQNGLRQAEQRLAAGGDSPAATGTNILRESGTLGNNSQVLASDGSLFNTHTFNGQAGQVVEINLVSSEFDTYLALLDANRQVLGQNDDVREGNTNSFLRVTLPSTGSYTIVVNGLEKTSRGRYNLSVIVP